MTLNNSGGSGHSRATATDGAPSAEVGKPSATVSVLTAAHNVERYIGEAIESVLRQTFREFEYIIVDDGSTDRTLELIYRHSLNDDRIRVVGAEHGGVANARNLGLRQASGEFIAFLDGDDRWHPDFLTRQLATLSSLGPEFAGIFARSIVISETGRRYAVRWQRAGRYDFDDMLVQACPPRCGSSLLIRKTCFDRVGEFTTEHGPGDLNMWLRIQRDSGMPYFWGNPAYLLDLRVRRNSISRNHEVTFQRRDLLAKEFAPSLRRYPPGMAYVRFAVFAFRAGREDFALPWARLAWQAGWKRLVADTYGWRLIGWTVVPAAGRRLIRHLDSVARSIFGRMAGLSGGLLR